MNTIMRWLAAAILVWSGTVQAQVTTTVVFESDHGDYIGGGTNQTFSAPQWSFRASGGNANLQLDFNNGNSTYWTAEFSAPTSLTPGRYGNADRYPFNSPRLPGLSISGDGRGCNTSMGWFEVLEFVVNASGTPVRAAINFRQACEGGSAALYGAIRLNSAMPINIPTLRAVTGPKQEVISGDTVVLEGGESFDRNTDATKSFRWVQTAGTPVTLDDPTNPYPVFTAPVVAAGGETARFALTFSDSNGATDTVSTDVLIHAPGDPVNYVRFSGDGSDYITGGRSYSFNPTNSSLSFVALSGSSNNGVEVRVNGDSYWTLDFASPQNTSFRTGSYEGAMRYPFQDATAPGLSVYGDGRGCNTLTGRFDVVDAAFNLATRAPTRLDIKFEQHCEGGSSKLVGELKYNADTPTTPPDGNPPPPPPATPSPTADAGPDFTVRRAQLATLNGSGSYEAGDTISAYHWLQVSGPSVRLRNPNSAKPTFIAPLLTKKAVLRFQLMVVDSHARTGSDTVDVTVGTQQN